MEDKNGQREKEEARVLDAKGAQQLVEDGGWRGRLLAATHVVRGGGWLAAPSHRTRHVTVSSCRAWGVAGEGSAVGLARETRARERARARSNAVSRSPKPRCVSCAVVSLQELVTTL